MKTRTRTRKKTTAPAVPDTAAVEASGLTVVEKKLTELNPAPYNPRRLTPEQKRQITTSIEKFGMVDPIIVNVNPDRMNVVVGGHQRLKVLKDLGWQTVPCVEVSLSERDEKELNLRLNKNVGDWDYVVLKDAFDFDMLTAVGFTGKELGIADSEYERKLANITNADAAMPIVQQMNEKYGMVCIVFKSELDFNWLKQVLKLRSEKCYKASRIGESHVLSTERMQKVWMDSLEEAGAGIDSEGEDSDS